MSSSVEVGVPDASSARSPVSATAAESSAATGAQQLKAESCSSGACMFSNYRTLAFLLPFLAVTGYSLSQGDSCAITGGRACAASAVAVGALAGLTSLGLVSAIKKFRSHKSKSA